MKPLRDKPSSISGRPLVFLWYQIVRFFIVAAIIPLETEASALVKWHDWKDIVNAVVEGGILKKQVGVVVLSDFRDSVRNVIFYEGSQPVIFRPADGDDASVNSYHPAN